VFVDEHTLTVLTTSYHEVQNLFLRELWNIKMTLDGVSPTFDGAEGRWVGRCQTPGVVRTDVKSCGASSHDGADTGLCDIAMTGYARAEERFEIKCLVSRQIRNRKSLVDSKLMRLGGKEIEIVRCCRTQAKWHVSSQRIGQYRLGIL
jgi:hypothetical protein